jgi:cobalt-zinc-cadmium efflux system membrane fusion protein
MKSLSILSIALAGLFFTSCKNHQEEGTTALPVISDSLIKTLPVAPVILSNESSAIKLNGKVEADESKLANVFALASGKIENVNVELGDYVEKGKVLAVLKSAEVASASSDIAMTKENVEMAKKSLQTTKDLYDSRLTSEQDYVNAKITYNKALADLNRAEQIASITGGSSSTYTITAPISGFIIAKNITGNSAVRADNSTALFSIADISKVWVTANAYEADMNSIHLNDSVIINTLASPGKDYYGTVNKIYNVLDPATRTMKVRINMNNSNNELKPEMFATVKINEKTDNKSLAVPSAAIVLDNSKNYVVIKEGSKLSVREITLIKRQGDTVYITGLNAGEQVVTASQVFLYQALTSN